MEPALNFGDYEQLCGRVLRTYNPPYNAQPKKMVYQFLTSSNQSLNKFYNDYIYLQRDVNLIKEDIFSVSDFFYIKNGIEITDPYDETNLRTGVLSPYLNNRVNMTIAQIDEKIGNITPTVGSVAATGAAIFYSYPTHVIALTASPIITTAVKSTIPTVRGKKITLNGLVPKFTLEHSVIAEAFNMGFNFKNTIISKNNIDDNKITYLKKSIENLDKVLKDLTEGVSVDKMNYLQNKLEKVNYDFYSLLDNFIRKAYNVIDINDPKNNAFTNLRVQLERVYSNNNFFESISSSIPYLENKFQMISELNFKCSKFEYSKLIFNDVYKYLSIFKEVSDIQSQDNYNLSILLDLIKILDIIPDVEDMEQNISDIGSDIYSFLKIKHTEYTFKNILVQKYEGKQDNEDNKKTIPDLDVIIDTVDEIPDQQLKQTVQFMPWCNTTSNDKYNLCKSLNNIFLSSGYYNLNLNVQEIKQKSDQIINEITTSENNETQNLITLKEELQVLYRNSFTLRNEEENPDAENQEQEAGMIKPQVNLNVKRKKTIKKNNRRKLNKSIKR
jgi:hypothetical protein